MLPAKMFSAELAGFEVRFFDQVPEERRLAVNNFRAEFDRFSPTLLSENSAADATARFQNVNAQTSGY